MRQAAHLWLRVFGLLRRSSPRLTILSTVLTLFEVVMSIATLYLIKLVIDVLSESLGPTGQEGMSGSVLFYLSATGGIMFVTVIVQAIASYVRTYQGLVVSDFVDREIHDRAVQVDLAFYESPKYFDLLERARAAGPQRPAQVTSRILLALKSLIFVVAVLVMITAIDWRILPAVLVIVGAILVVRLWFTRVMFEWQRRRTQLERRASYLDWLVTSDIHAKELRLGELGGFLRDAYGKIRQLIRAETIGIEKRRSLAEMSVAGGGAIVFVFATILLAQQTLEGTRSLGDLVLFLLLFRRAESSGREFVSNISRLYDDQLYLRQLFDFLSVEPTIYAPAVPQMLPDSDGLTLRFEDVSFSYPGTQVTVPDSIDLELGTGRFVALVGANGSGKTSIIKLLTRLYDPTDGRITLNGRDIRDFRPEEYRRLFSVIFQDYAHYAEPVAENIRFGDIRSAPDRTRIEDAARQSGADEFVRDFDRGYDTPLTKLFDDGKEISIGQWQKIALARAFYPKSRFLVLDEPTSALDPKAEAELFENFAERVEGRGSLVISHRLSTVRMADFTYVLDRGRIVERGTHDDLVAMAGHYQSLFELQGRNYRI